jgi:hypothetical protein
MRGVGCSIRGAVFARAQVTCLLLLEIICVGSLGLLPVSRADPAKLCSGHEAVQDLGCSADCYWWSIQGCLKRFLGQESWSAKDWNVQVRG